MDCLERKNPNMEGIQGDTWHIYFRDHSCLKHKLFLGLWPKGFFSYCKYAASIIPPDLKKRKTSIIPLPTSYPCFGRTSHATSVVFHSLHYIHTRQQPANLAVSSSNRPIFLLSNMRARKKT
jgi:hypothetical protein